MKKQLIALTALFVVSTTQCDFFSDMKAKANAAYNKAKATIQRNLPAVKQMVSENLPAVQEFAKTNILPTAQKIAEDQVILGDKLDSLAQSVPGGEQAMNKIRDLYMSKYHPTFKKNANGQWEDTAKVVTSRPATPAELAEFE